MYVVDGVFSHLPRQVSAAVWQRAETVVSGGLSPIRDVLVVGLLRCRGRASLIDLAFRASASAFGSRAGVSAAEDRATA